MKHDTDDQNDSPTPKVRQVLMLLDRLRDEPNSEKLVFESSGSIDGISKHQPALESDLPDEIGRFQIRSLLGEGGYGVVLRAHDPQLKRDVAIKVPRPETLLTDDRRARFIQEGEAAAALSHPSIVPVFEAGKAGSFHYIASKYCPGRSLAQWLTGSDQPVPPRDAARVVVVLAEAIQHAHDRGVLHRDLKPANVLLEDGIATESKQGDRLDAASVRITDFGLARIDGYENDLTQSGSILGTPAYMSPEQAEGRQADIGPATDIYSLGAILYELLTGKPPFTGRSLLDTLDAVRNEEPRSPERERATVPRDLAAICMKCLDKEVANRYDSGHALQQDLNRFLDGHTVLARPSTKRERLTRWRRRNPTIAVLGTLATALLMCLGAGSTMAAFVLAKSNRQSLDNLEQAVQAKEDATEKETLALQAVFEARIAQAKASRTSRAVGQREESLSAIRKAAGQLERLNYGEAERLELRNGVIASLSLIDLKLDRQWPIDDLEFHATATDSAMNTYAAFDRDNDLTIRSMTDNSEITRIKLSISPNNLLLMSRDGRFVAARFRDPESVRYARVWNVARKELVYSRRIQKHPVQAFCFSPDGKQLAMICIDSAIELVSLPELDSPNSKLVAKKRITDQPHVLSVQFDRAGQRLALIRDSKIDILNIRTGQIEQSITTEASFVSLDYLAVNFSPDGKSIAAACTDNVVRIWDIETADLSASFRGHGGQVTSVSIHPNGRYLATGSQDSTTRIWRIDNGQQLLEAPQSCTCFSDDGKWLGRPAGRWRFLDSESTYRRFPWPWTGMHPSGRFGISNVDGNKPTLVEVASGRQIPADLGTGFATFMRDGRNLVVSVSDTFDQRRSIFRLPISLDLDSEQDADSTTTNQDQIHKPSPTWVRIGPPVKISETEGGRTTYRAGMTKFAIAHRNRPVRIVDVEQGNSTTISMPSGSKYSIDLSSDGKFLATGGWYSRNVSLMDCTTGKRAGLIRNVYSSVGFRPHSNTLVTGDDAGYVFRSIDALTATSAPTIKRISRGRSGEICFSADGRLLAVTLDQRTVGLYDPDSRTQLATIQFDSEDEVVTLQLSDDLQTLMVATQRCTYLCDLGRLRLHLAKFGLDWSDGPIVRHEKLAFEVDAGELGDRQPSQDISGRISNGRFTASSQYSEQFAASHVFDDSRKRWLSTSQDYVGAWIAVSWDQPQTFRRIRIREVYDRITGFRIQQKQVDEDQWSDLFVAEGETFAKLRKADPLSNWNLSNRRYPRISFDIELEAPYEAKAIRFLVTDAIDRKEFNISIQEMEFE